LIDQNDAGQSEAATSVRVPIAYDHAKSAIASRLQSVAINPIGGRTDVCT
jgi:hypothetical protein